MPRQPDGLPVSSRGSRPFKAAHPREPALTALWTHLRSDVGDSSTYATHSAGYLPFFHLPRFSFAPPLAARCLNALRPKAPGNRASRT